MRDLQFVALYRGYHRPYSTSTAIGMCAGSPPDLDDDLMISRPSQNFGSWSPGTKSRSTPASVITHIRITPPEEPSRDMARARAVRVSLANGDKRAQVSDRS